MVNDERKTKAIKEATLLLLEGKKIEAQKTIDDGYPFVEVVTNKRNYSINQKMEQFVKDGFIDRYSGVHLVNPGILRVLSIYLDQHFPYHPHGKMTASHASYWEIFPTIDHIVPIARGGLDNQENWATTSMLNNSIKSNWTLEQMQWKLFPKGSIKDWDGLTKELIQIVRMNEKLNDITYIKQWYKASLLFLNDK